MKFNVDCRLFIMSLYKYTYIYKIVDWHWYPKNAIGVEDKET